MKLIIGNRNYSSWSLRAWLMLKATGVSFETRRLALDTPDFEDAIGDYSPARRVPVLIDGELQVWDSLAIGEYLAERFPQARLWPADADRRAMARSLSAEMHAGFAALRREMPMNCRADGRRIQPGTEARRDIDRVLEIWENCCAARTGRGPWLMGGFGIVDAMYVPVALRFRTYGIAVRGNAARFMRLVQESVFVCEWIAAAQAEPETIEKEEKGRIKDG